MAYGALVQQAFMSGPPAFGARQPVSKEGRKIKDTLPCYEFPAKCTVPSKKDEFMLFAMDPSVETPLQMPISGKGLVMGSSQVYDGQVLNRDKGVCPQHCAILHSKGKLFLKSIEGDIQIQSISLHNFKDRDGRPARKYVNSKGVTLIDMRGGVSGLHKFTKEMSVFYIGKSQVVYWIDGPLPLGDNEYLPQEPAEKKKRETRERETTRETVREEKPREKESSRVPHEKEKEPQPTTTTTREKRARSRSGDRRAAERLEEERKREDRKREERNERIERMRDRESREEKTRGEEKARGDERTREVKTRGDERKRSRSRRRR